MACPQPNPNARLRLFCLPYAGNGTLVYHAWPKFLPADVELCPIRLPGREGRLKEKPYVRLLPLVKVIAEAMLPLLDKPFALFGHSMGALLTFELAHLLQRQYARPAAHLFVSGRNAPDFPDLLPVLHQLPDAQFIARVQEYFGGLPEMIINNPDMLRLFLPTLRADFSVIETYVYRGEPPLDIPISVFGGRLDNQTTPEGLAAWRQHTRRAFTLQLFPGDHFFLQSQQEPLLAVIAKLI